MSEAEESRLERLVYWIRVVLGTILGAMYAVYWRESWGGFLSAVSYAILFYILTYYLITISLGSYRVEILGGTRKIFTIGIGIFFISWLFFWILLYTLFFHIH